MSVDVATKACLPPLQPPLVAFFVSHPYPLTHLKDRAILVVSRPRSTLAETVNYSSFVISRLPPNPGSDPFPPKARSFSL
jgi:hypothetical protein